MHVYTLQEFSDYSEDTVWSGEPDTLSTAARLRAAAYKLGLTKPGELNTITGRAVVDWLCSERGYTPTQARSLPVLTVLEMLGAAVPLKPDEKESLLTLEDQAIGLLSRGHSVKEIAARLGVSRSTPYTWLRFKAAVKAARTARSKAILPPRGTKDRFTGEIEAWDDE